MALTDYHQPPRITLEQAIQIARPFLVELAEWHNTTAGRPFDDAEMHFLSPMCWEIFAWEPREGACYPRPKAYIDKLDRHRWTDGEMNLLHGL